MNFSAGLKNWLFRWQGDGTQPIVLGQRRIFILPARAGLFFGLVLIVMLLGAINYNLALGHALVFLLASLGLAGMVHTFRNLLGLGIAGGRPEPVFAGELAHFPLHVANDRAVPRPGLEFRVDDQAPVRLDLGAGSSVRVDLPVPARQRGWLELPRIRLETRYPLGFFVAWSYPRPAMRCLVYPRPLPSPLPPAVSTGLGGAHHGDGGQDDFAGLREHQPADSPRHVSWKAVARNGDARPLLVKQFAGGAHSELWLEWRATPADMDTETRISLLAGWVLAAEAAGLLYGLRLPGRDIAPDLGGMHRDRCLEALALLPASP